MPIRYRKRELLGQIDSVGTYLVFGATYGYFAGGYVSVLTYKITFSTGVTAASSVSNLSAQRYRGAALSDKSLYGYFTGGSDSGGTYLSSTDRITFSTSTTAANTASNLSAARRGLAGVSDGTTYGYFCGGDTGGGGYGKTTDRITFSTGATAVNTASNLSVDIQGGYGLSSGTTYGYIAQGYNVDVGYTSKVDRITFSTSVTAANTASNISSNRALGGGLSDGTTYGYFCGGITGAAVVTTDRITFSTSATAANTASNLSAVKYELAYNNDGTTYGYCVSGADNSGATRTADRMTYSTGVFALNTASNIGADKQGIAGLSDLAI